MASSPFDPVDRFDSVDPFDSESELSELSELTAPGVVFPGQSAPQSAYRVAHDLLSRRAPAEALAVLEPALAEDPRNTGLRSLRAWAFLIRVQLNRAEEELLS